MATAFATYKKYITPDVMPCPDVIIERELVNTLIDFCKLTHVITKDFNVELDSDDIDSDYQDAVDVDLTEFFTDYRPVAVVRINIDGVEYTPKYSDVLNEIDCWDSNIDSGNVKFFSFVDNNTLRIYNMSTSNDQLYLKMALKPIHSITEVQDEFLYEDHIETIAHGVKWRILNMPGKAWTNKQAARDSWIQWRRGVSKARMNFDKGYTRTPGEVYPRSFGDLD